jgi:hypothetical protein
MRQNKGNNLQLVTKEVDDVPIYNLANGDSLQVPPSNIDGE